MTTVALATTAGLAVVGTSSVAADDHALEPLGVYDSGVGEGGSEIVAVDTDSLQMYVTNGELNRIDIVDISDPDAPTLVGSVDMGPFGGGVQSVSVGNGLVGAAVRADDDLANGSVVVFDSDGSDPVAHEVGNLPDSIAFTDNGRYIVVANEAEPVCDDDTLVADPEGSVSIVDVRRGRVATAEFARFNDDEAALLDAGVRIFFPGSTVAQDLEPEFVTTTKNSKTAYVTLQENNAIAVVDIASATVTDILPLGFKDHSAPGNGLDPSNRDGAERIANYDVLGMYQPDSIASVKIKGGDYLVTANEGDARDYDCYSEEERVGDFGLGADYDDELDENEFLGRLRTTSAFPTTFDDQGRIEQVYAYGARSFTIWDTAGSVVFDSGDELEQLLVGTPFFNLDGDETDERSDDKGPEPEALAVGKVDGRTFAFVGLERSGGIAMYDITVPSESVLVDYVNTAELGDDDVVTESGDVGPEGIAFIPADASPTGSAMIAVSFEISGTTRLFAVG